MIAQDSLYDHVTKAIGQKIMVVAVQDRQDTVRRFHHNKQTKTKQLQQQQQQVNK